MDQMVLVRVMGGWKMERGIKWLLATVGVSMVAYTLVVLGFVASSPDLRLRSLLVDPQPESGMSIGLQIRAVPGRDESKGTPPKPGDVLVRIGRKSIRSFPDYTAAMTSLRNAEIPPGGHLHAGADPSELDEFSLPWIVEEGGRRWVEIEFVPQGTTSHVTSHLLVQSLPLGEVVLSFVWFILQMGVFVIGGMAYWNRPSDRPSRLFFILCIVTLGAYVGGYHWWVIAGSLWLNVPFVVSAMLVPVVTLHFFLMFPRPKSAMSERPWSTIANLYTIPALGMLVILAMLGYSSWLQVHPAGPRHIESQVQILSQLRIGIFVYVGVAAVYFVVTLAVLRRSYVTSHNPLERTHLKWMWRAGQIAAVFVGITLFLAVFRQTDFALGGARIPMFLASLSFLLAYAIGIVRYKMALIDRIISKGVLYYAVSSCVTAVFALAIALSLLVPQYLNIFLSAQQAAAITAVLVLLIVLLLWLRDLIQRAMDQRFFREKYQLDKALQRINRVVGHLVDPDAVAAMMLGSCRDALRVHHATLYFRQAASGPFQLVVSDGEGQIPLQFEADDEFLSALKGAGSVQRVTPDSRDELSAVQYTLRELDADLVHALESDQGIVGLILLGRKKIGTSFSAEDLTFLAALGQITNVALHSAKVDQDISRVSEELRLKSKQIAEQRRRIALLQAELSHARLAVPKLLSAPAVSPASEEFHRGELIGNGPAMQQVLETVRKVVTGNSSVLLRGESGTGKELLARIVHENSPRRNGPMIRVHCASLSAGLLESELFGHVKGAFTGAYRDKVGRFELADGGTIFLDEIGDITLETQVKLLRVLQERCFEPVGGTQTRQVDVRLITATHQNLEDRIAEGAFREDLYYRLNVISITLPTLRERPEDLLDLILHFLHRTAARIGKPVHSIDDEVIAVLERYAWPGNIRELENVIERAVVMADGSMIVLHDLPAEVLAPAPQWNTEVSLIAASDSDAAFSVDHSRRTSPVVAATIPRRSPADERSLLLNALRSSGGNKARAARLLGMPRSTFFSRLKKYDIQ